MDNNDSPMDLWNFMGFFEKQHLMQQFRKIHGNNYNKDDFYKFLAERSNDLKVTSRLVDEKKDRWA